MKHNLILTFLLFVFVQITWAGPKIIEVQKQVRNFSGTVLILVKKGDFNFVCSATAISRRKLITAAHCLDNARSVKMLLGHELLESNQFIHASSFEMHPKYSKQNSNYLYDIGKVSFNYDLPKSISHYPINQAYTGGELARVGFGARQGLNRRNIFENMDRFRIKGGHLNVYDAYSFSGDSGGAVFQIQSGKLVLVAVHSTIEGHTAFNPTLYPALNWIRP